MCVSGLLYRPALVGNKSGDSDGDNNNNDNDDNDDNNDDDDDDLAGTVTSSVGHLSQTTMEELNRHDRLQASLSQFDLTRSEQVWTPSVAALKRRPEVDE